MFHVKARDPRINFVSPRLFSSPEAGFRSGRSGRTCLRIPKTAHGIKTSMVALRLRGLRGLGREMWNSNASITDSETLALSMKFTSTMTRIEV